MGDNLGIQLGKAGIDTAQDITGSLLGLALEGHNDRRQLKQQQSLTNIQMQANKEMAQFNYDQQLKLWNATNYGPQIDQLKKAGLNPALIYGMSGGGGATTAAAQGGMASSGNAPQGGGEIMGMMMNKAQLEILQAQKQNIEADTANKQSENPNIPLQGQQIKANIANLTQGIENQKAVEELTKVQTQLSQLNYDFTQASFEDRLDQIHQDARRLTGQASQALIQANVDESTKNTKINTIQQEFIGKVLENALLEMQKTETGSKIQLNEQQIQESAARIKQNWKELGIKGQLLILQQELQKYNTNPSWNKLWNSLLGSAGHTIEGIIQK